ncbi:MAG: hypothetical protein A2157_16615 [Deltaproteobacteria bacterium RBG_16_47_11]|nr:MAG: hypothetical protein A2157_16615 [Deltaproteobacteria bacterium RBG_16_47_11]
MDVNIIYNVEHEISLGIPIATYFYLTGLSAGSFIISTFAYGFGMTKFKPLGKIGVIMATLILVIAPMILLIDLEQPLRFWHLIFYLRITSPITWGTFLLTLYPMNCVVYGYFMFKGDMKKTKIFGLIGIPLALMVHGYTGFILALGKDIMEYGHYASYLSRLSHGLRACHDDFGSDYQRLYYSKGKRARSDSPLRSGKISDCQYCFGSYFDRY